MIDAGEVFYPKLWDARWPYSIKLHDDHSTFNDFKVIEIDLLICNNSDCFIDHFKLDRTHSSSEASILAQED
uniref:Uncharacterized protein n=1 Tax=Romanomermis culicivorax TaxID=13658 RepID=A0A915HHA8_ROMCU